MDNGVKVLFSGRFDPPHPGHIATVIRLSKLYPKVVLVILDYEGRSYPVEYVQEVFRECLERYPVEIYSNRTHFGNITMEEFQEFNCGAYAAGNLSVLRHIEKLGIKVTYTERAFDYSASNYKRILASEGK